MSDQVVDFAPLRIKQVVRETDDAVSLVLDVPAEHSAQFRYRAGQFLTLAVTVAGNDHRRCYSMSSFPHNGNDLRITIKRDPGGLVSNYLNDTAEPGQQIRALPPDGRFVLGEAERDIVAFAGGSGITPIFSLLGSALATTRRRVKLFYANRTRDSVIFGRALDDLAAANPDRLTVTHHFDEEAGVVRSGAVAAFVNSDRTISRDVDYYICGPGPFMDTVEHTLLNMGVPRDRVHLERFSVVPAPVTLAEATAQTTEIVIELDRRTTTVEYRPGNTLLQTARMAGLRAPSSCETGSCGTCMARVVCGSARMLNNDALDDDEVADGWVLTCQSVPTSPTVHVVYE
ncbi:2Fe-2S iron-sulfur cluster-binding protein [Mycolicibacterium phlei]|uniref:2Fe-2S iron-sulfur cluster-binding protein n=1 Tax=Mycolicibacterium phlei TaxID=1771 RepID=UPI0037C84D62